MWNKILYIAKMYWISLTMIFHLISICIFVANLILQTKLYFITNFSKLTRERDSRYIMYIKYLFNTTQYQHIFHLSICWHAGINSCNRFHNLSIKRCIEFWKVHRIYDISLHITCQSTKRGHWRLLIFVFKN